MSFEDFLDMLSVFSDSATSDIKSHYAFRIFGNSGGRRSVLGSSPCGWGQPARAGRALTVPTAVAALGTPCGDHAFGRACVRCAVPSCRACRSSRPPLP